MIYSVIGAMGKGKTLFCSLMALLYSLLFPNNKIYSNFKLNLPNAIYTQLMLFSLTDLHDCMIICDDFYAMKNLENLIAVMVNLSRKNNIQIYLTCQYYSMINRMIRTLSEIIDLDLQKKEELLFIRRIDMNRKIHYYVIDKVFSRINNLYNTNEVVEFALDSEIEKEIVNKSKNKRDLEYNIKVLIKNKYERTKLMKKLLPFFENT
jgi:hypothetical protein